MARAGSAVHAMRIIALPLTRPGRHSTKQVLTYYQFQVHHSDKSGARDRKKTPSTVGRYANLAQQKALDIWDRFGNADEGNWKRRIHRYGERLVDSLDFEEHALRGVDPTLGPSIRRLRASGTNIKTDTVGSISDIRKKFASSRSIAS